MVQPTVIVSMLSPLSQCLTWTSAQVCYNLLPHPLNDTKLNFFLGTQLGVYWVGPRKYILTMVAFPVTDLHFSSITYKCLSFYGGTFTPKMLVRNKK
jgi:hypothetical protein